MVSRELAGRVYVDHGRVVVCDPQYVGLSDRDAEALVDGGDAVRLDLGEAAPDHLAVAVASGWGDGWYPCWVEYADVDGVQTVSRLVVDFLVTTEGARELDRALVSEGVDEDVRRRALGDSNDKSR